MPGNTLTIEYPAEILWALNRDPEEFAQEARLLLAVWLYESGKLSSGLAAKLAAVPRETFLVLLGRYGISPFAAEPEEIEQDLADAQQARHSQ